MAKSIRAITKRPRGRPVTTGKGTLVGVRLTAVQLSRLDRWIAGQSARMTRPEAMRVMMETTLPILLKDAGEKPSKKVKRK